MERVSTIKELLKNRKLKVTTTRIDVLEHLMSYASAMPYSLLQKKLKNTDRITLYRTIKTLIEKGLIHQAIFSQEETYYAVCSNTCTHQSHLHNHIHFKCNKCLEVSCEHLKKEISVAVKGLQISEVSINASGLCRKCSGLN